MLLLFTDSALYCLLLLFTDSALYCLLLLFTDSSDAISNDLITAGLLEMKDMVVGKSNFSFPCSHVFMFPFQLQQIY